MPRGTRQSYTDEQLRAHVDRARGKGQLSPGEELLLDRPYTQRWRAREAAPPQTALEAEVRRNRPRITASTAPPAAVRAAQAILPAARAVTEVVRPFTNNSAVGVFQSPRPRPQQPMTTAELIAADNERVRRNRALVGNGARVIASAIGRTLDDVFPGNRNRDPNRRRED